MADDYNEVTARNWYRHNLEEELARAGDDEDLRAAAYSRFAARIALAKT